LGPSEEALTEPFQETRLCKYEVNHHENKRGKKEKKKWKVVEREKVIMGKDISRNAQAHSKPSRGGKDITSTAKTVGLSNGLTRASSLL